MYRLPGSILLLIIAISASPVRGADRTTTATCTFEDGRQMSARYSQGAARGKDELPLDKVWTPGKEPILLFTQAEISADSTAIPTGAYSMYLIPGKENWTLVINKNVRSGSKYDEHQDLLRIAMPTGELGQPQNQFTVVFGHIGAKQCNMRIYYGKIGAWAEFHEK
jgi:hypothetical protein